MCLMPPFRALIAVLPCHDLDASEAFYNRLGFTAHCPTRSRPWSASAGGRAFLIPTPATTTAEVKS
jgi:hypothetical protein